jgi:microsomal dipeptidase-like Zn-dependent dipeptidase
MPYIADIHTHSTLKPNLSDQTNQPTIWTDFKTNELCKKVGCLVNLVFDIKGTVATYSQSHFEACLAGNARLIIIALHPPEVPYFKINAPINRKRLVNTGVCLSGFSKAYIENRLWAVNNPDSPTEVLNYYQALQEELQFLKNQTNLINGNKKVRIASNWLEAKNYLDDPNTIVCILSIEGLHALNDFSTYHDYQKVNFADVNTESSLIYQTQLTKYTQRIQAIKQWGKTANDGSYAPLYITFNHHFWNYMGGHSQSLKMSPFVKQNQEMNQPLTLLGKKVIDLLLSQENGKRILIDIKHMSVEARQEYYQILKNNSAYSDVPIICSHTCISGIHTMQKLIEIREQTDNYKYDKEIVKDEETDPARLRDGVFDDWDINLADDELLKIRDSHGLLGLILNRDRMPGLKIQIDLKKYEATMDAQTALRNIYTQLIAQNILHIIKVCGSKGWDIICIGSDFDGLINPMKNYDKSAYFNDLKNALLEWLSQIDMQHFPKEHIPKGCSIASFKNLMQGINVNEVVDKIMYKNVENFLEKYFNDAYLKNGILPA